MTKDNEVSTITPREMSGLERELIDIGISSNKTEDFVRSILEATDNAVFMYMSKNLGEEFDEDEACPYCTSDLQEALSISLSKYGFEDIARHPYILIKYLGEWGVLLGYGGSKEKVRLSEQWESEMKDYLNSQS
jgi:hypothetical protein